MSKSGQKIAHFFAELRRRKTIRVAVAYIVVAWVFIQGAELVLDAWQAEPWVLQWIIIALIAGLGVAIVLSWIFDITPEGLTRTDDLDEEDDEVAQEQTEALKRSVSIELGSAHRRQVTIVNGAIELISDGDVVSDPETMHAILPRLEEIIDKAIGRYAGYRLSDATAEFEVLFGYPAAREDDAGRAVAASLAIVNAIDRIVIDEGSVEPAARLTVHTDTVVVEVSDSADNPIKVVGATSRVASWLQALSAPNSVTLTGNTYSLLRDRFRCESLGEHRYAPLNIETTVYRALELTAPAESLIIHDDDAHLVVGRDSEIALLLDRWDRAVDGEGQFVVLRGEPGIGKSTLVRRIVAEGRNTENASVMPMYCSPFESNKAYHPIIEYLLGPALGPEKINSDDVRERKIRKLLTDSGLDAERVAPLMSMLLSIGDTTIQAEQTTGEAYRNEMQDCLLQIFRASAKGGPVMLVFEDLHWADPSTLEILNLLVTSGANPGAFCLFTTRPSLGLEWDSRSDVTTLDLQRLSQRVTRNLVNNILGDTDIPPPMMERIVSETGGNPLFAEELTRAVSESIADSDEPNPEETLAHLTLPGTLQQSLASRIDNLGDAKKLLQLCSLLGREFDYKLLRAVSETENEAALQEELRMMVNAEFLFQTGAPPDSRYVFKHILMQETAYDSLLKKTRTQLHAQVAEILEQEFPDERERHPQKLALHFGEAGVADKAIPYWMMSCKLSLDTFANLEAIEQANAALKLLAKTPDSVQRGSTEITLRMMRGKALVATRGYSDPEVERNFVAALALCEQIGDPPELFQLLVGLWMNFFISGELDHSLALARRLVRIAEKESSPPKIVQAKYCHGFTVYSIGDYNHAREVLEASIAAEAAGFDFASESASGDDTRTHTRCALALVLWHLGHLEKATSLAHEGLEMARDTGHPYAMIFTEFMNAYLDLLRGDHEQAAVHAEAVIRLAEDNMFGFWLAFGKYFLAWSTCEAGRSGSDDEKRQRINDMIAGLDAFYATGAGGLSSPLSLQIVEGLISTGELAGAEERLSAIEEKLRASNEQQFIHELTRYRGRVAQAKGDTQKAEELFEAALRSSREAGSVSLALRAATDLAKLYADGGNDQAASQLLEAAYGDLPERERA